MAFIVIFIATAVAAALSWVFYMIQRAKSNVKGPIPYPFVANAHLLVVNSSEFINVLKRLEDECDLVGQISLFTKRYVFTSHPKVLEAILTSNELITKGVSYIFLRPWLGDGLLTSTGQRWKAHRKFLTPAFHFNILQNFLPVFCKNRKVLRNKLRDLAGGPSIDLFPLVALAALDNVTESIMGVSVNAQSDRDSEFVKAVDMISSIISTRMRNVFVAPDIIFNMLPIKTVQDKALRILHGQTNKVITARREDLLKSQKTEIKTDAEHGIKNKHAFLDLLLLAEVDGKKISDESIREEVNTFMFEGHDTTSSGIVYCLYALSQREDIQEKIYEEQKSLLGTDLERDPTYQELHQMKYLELVIKESLRLYPSVPMIERYVTQDTDLAGWHIPKGTSIVMDFFNMQRNPDFYEDPLEFRPERFENTSRNPFYWLSFSAGARNCIGQKFAMMEIKVTIADIVNNFKILPSGEEPLLAADLILRSRNGVKINLVSRN